MMIAAYATAVITVQRNIRLPTPHRKVMTNTTMKMAEKIAAKVAILSIARALTSSLNEFSQPSVNQLLQFWGAVTPSDSGPRGIRRMTDDAINIVKRDGRGSGRSQLIFGSGHSLQMRCGPEIAPCPECPEGGCNDVCREGPFCR
jgi:hypothetical protein